MCGIAGVWSANESQRLTTIQGILKSQHHRGPDNCSFSEFNNIALGHNRLAIIDLSEGANQPMLSSCGRYGIVFNGEIYNFKELRASLDYQFSTSSDTEVLLAAFIKYGYDLLPKLNGMFAFAIYDLQQDSLFLARDRIGKKPLVYSEHKSGFYFASELAALYNTGVFSDEIDEIGVGYSFLRNFRHVPEPYTKYKEIRRLEPSHAMIVKNGKIQRKWCYWTPEFDVDSSIQVHDVRDVIDDAVSIRERADVEIATLLSGGVDSSIITGLMVEHGLNPRTFCLKADQEEFERAEFVASHFGVSLEVFEYDKDLQEELYTKLTRIYGEEVRLLPLTHAARLYREISKHGIKVVMTGLGADEIFYGYDGANRQMLFSDIVKFMEVLPNKLLSTFEKIFTRSPELKLLFELAQQKNNRRKGYLYKKEALDKGLIDFDYSTLLNFWADKINATSYIDSANWLGLITENAHSITISSDLPAMMYSIETRAPFLDYRVIELALRIDAHRKISKKSGRANNKLILKQAFEDLVPEHILYASKKGFGYGIKNEKFNG
ncbi:asparagine synthase (glutamine-hydrolyzing) [Vibrio sp. 10N.286.49.C2]|uniref:asparagine synthase (glutamine-hydrolyzing) n=1 Tax=unclassified Vibrio TaxID=2614977 RepID=UPI000C81893A|nr:MULTISPECIES: asparagine synthase (glutamine-hydrolyzing) [unclassified Vibrio]PMH32824.1 asparagine synthase (glutamine-hydrolyzing) [Vibrio sp. 10N.286.49.C2]PMH57543.1 asparagine synthase (glutamine-hydrolyzing) [Vibrio sp. 10N.286.49.B1]